MGRRPSLIIGGGPISRFLLNITRRDFVKQLLTLAGGGLVAAGVGEYVL
ncbi:MAG: twin-arginine translocation signal domain-containing protein, partial [Thaumarchaeota archaeon]